MELKLFLITTILAVEILGAPEVLLRQYNSPYANGKYEYGYETANGIQRYEKGILKPISKGTSVIVTEGSYSFTAPNNVVYTVRYIADENGFRILPAEKEAGGKTTEVQTGGNFGVKTEDKTEGQTTIPPPVSFRRTDPVIPYDEGIDNRVAIPPDLIGSLIGGR